jgi:hypothetical protein
MFSTNLDPFTTKYEKWLKQAKGGRHRSAEERKIILKMPLLKMLYAENAVQSYSHKAHLPGKIVLVPFDFKQTSEYLSLCHCTDQ